MTMMKFTTYRPVGFAAGKNIHKYANAPEEQQGERKWLFNLLASPQVKPIAIEKYKYNFGFTSFKHN